MATSSDLDYEVVFPESTTLAAKCTTAQATIGPGKQTLLLPAAAPGAPKAIKVQNVAGENVKAARALSPNSNFSPLALVILADIAQSNGVIDAEALPLVRDAIMRCSAAELAALRLHTLLVRPEDDAAALWLPADDCTASEEGKPVLASPRIESVRTKICFINLRDCAIDCAWVAFNGQEDNGCKQNQARPWRVLPGHQLDISSVPGHLFRIYESSSFLGKRVWLGGVEVGSPLAQHDAVTALAGQLPAPVGPLARSADKKSCQLYVIT